MEKNISKANQFDYGIAMLNLRNGFACSRVIWKNIDFVCMMPELQLAAFNDQENPKKVNDRTAKWIGESTPLNCRPYFASYTKEGNLWQPGWLPSQSDMFGTDWFVYKLEGN